MQGGKNGRHFYFGRMPVLVAVRFVAITKYFLTSAPAGGAGELNMLWMLLCNGGVLFVSASDVTFLRVYSAAEEISSIRPRIRRNQIAGTWWNAQSHIGRWSCALASLAAHRYSAGNACQ
jgi:hypothetical protein